MSLLLKISVILRLCLLLHLAKKVCQSKSRGYIDLLVPGVLGPRVALVGESAPAALPAALEVLKLHLE